MKFHLQRQDADADLYLEDENGAVLHSGTRSETSRDGIVETLQAGTYHVRVAAREEGKNFYELVYRAGEPEPSVSFRVTEPGEPPPPPPTIVDPDPTPSNVRVTDPVDERAEVIRHSVSEPDGTDFADDISTQGRVAVNGFATGYIGKRNDVDWFAVTLEAGHTYRIQMKSGDGSSARLPDPYLLGIHDAEGKFIEGTANDDIFLAAGDSNQSIMDSAVFFTPTESGTYYVAADNGSRYFGPHGRKGTYTVVVTDTSTDDFTADTDTAGSVPIGGSAAGRIEALDDVDWFAVTLEKGTSYRLDLEGSGRLELQGEALIGIYDADGSLIPGTARDNKGMGGNIRTWFAAPETGTYYVAAGTDSKYVSPAAAESIIFPYGFNPLKLLGSRGVEASKHEYRVGTYELSVVKVPDDFTADNTARAGSVTVGDSAAGEIGHRGDVDWFAVTLDKGRMYQFDQEGAPSDRPHGALAKPALIGIYDETGDLVAAQTIVDPEEGISLRELALSAPARYLEGHMHRYVRYVYDESPEEPQYGRMVFTAPESGTYYVAAAASYEPAKGTIMYDREDFTKGYYRPPPAEADSLGAYSLAVKAFKKDEYAANTGTTGRIMADTDSTEAVSDDGSATDGDGAAAQTAPVGRVPAGGGTATGEIGHPGDHDWFAMAFESGKTYRIDLKGAWSRDGTLTDPYLRGVHDSAGEFLDWPGYFSHPGHGRPTDDDGGNGTNARLYFTPNWNGVHYIAVSGDGDNSLGTYTLAVEEFTYGL